MINGSLSVGSVPTDKDRNAFGGVKWTNYNSQCTSHTGILD